MAIFSGDKMGRGASVIRPARGGGQRHANISISLVGDKELIAKLMALGPKVYKNVVSKAARRAMAPVIKTARQLAPKETGQLRKSIGVKQKKYPRNGRIVTIVGPRTGFEITTTVDTIFGKLKTTRNPVKYAHLVEYGTRAHTLASVDGDKLKIMSHPGATAKPFMRPAFDANEQRAVSIMRSELAAGVVREARGK